MVLWSLFFEALANLVWLSIVKFPVRVVAAVALFGLLGILFPSFCRLPGASIGAALLNEWPRVTYSFFVGTLLYRCYRLGRLSSYSLGPLAISFVLLTIWVTPAGFWSRSVDVVAIIVVFPVFVWLGANRSKPTMSRLSRLLGDLSYPVYLLQIPIMWTMTGLVKSAHLFNARAEVLLTVIAPITICCISWVIFKYYDVPLRRWLQEVLSRQFPKAS